MKTTTSLRSSRLGQYFRPGLFTFLFSLMLLSCLLQQTPAASPAPGPPVVATVGPINPDPLGESWGGGSALLADSSLSSLLNTPVRWALSSQRHVLQVATVGMCLALWIMMRK